MTGFRSRVTDRIAKWGLPGLRLAAFGLAAIIGSAIVTGLAVGSDHADTPEIAASPGTDLSDVFMFPSPGNPNNVVLAMCVRPLIPAGQTASFDPSVLYQFKIDNTGDSVEDLVIQATFAGSGAGQVATIRGPAAPPRTGVITELVTPQPTTGPLGAPFSPAPGMQAFCGVREDPFFFDLERFFQILPDRATPITGQAVANPNTPQAASWRSPAEAVDFLINFNVLAIVVELPKAQLGNGVIGVWCTTSR